MANVLSFGNKVNETSCWASGHIALMFIKKIDDNSVKSPYLKFQNLFPTF